MPPPRDATHPPSVRPSLSPVPLAAASGPTAHRSLRSASPTGAPSSTCSSPSSTSRRTCTANGRARRQHGTPSPISRNACPGRPFGRATFVGSTVPGMRELRVPKMCPPNVTTSASFSPTSHRSSQVRLDVTWGPYLPPESATPRLTLGSVSLFSALVVQLIEAASGARGIVKCSACSAWYAPADKHGRPRWPQAGRRHFCPSCRAAGVPVKIAAQEYRKRQREEDRHVKGKAQGTSPRKP